MIVFVDTSALYAGLDQKDINHNRAKSAWTDLLAGKAMLLTNNYVLLETGALLHHRLGPAAFKAFHQDLVPLLAVDWITQQRHQAGVEALLTAARRKLSLVDGISFQTMRQYGSQTAFCFDPHFREQGFDTIP
ncbi:MAG: PIN domain-containing protein [Bryobacteraceae bacterium]|jgi:predicted nucleic acid-binding protein